MHIWPPAEFCGFGLECTVPIHPIFVHCPLIANVARRWNDHCSIIVASSRVGYTDVDHCGLMCLNDLHQSPEGLPERGVSLMSKRSSLKRENHFLSMLAPMAFPPYTAQMFLTAFRCFCPSIELKEKNI